MTYLATSVAFLTRIPVPYRWTGGAEAVGKSSRWFPLVGLMIGAGYLAIFKLATAAFPSMVAAVLVVITEAFLTGALHMDGLADMADGFGGGHTREDVLRIMRDHVIGAYGAVALLLTLALKIAAITGLAEANRADNWLLLAPCLARWATAFSGFQFPYARRTTEEGSGGTGAVSKYVGITEVLVATLVAVGAAILISGWRGLVCWGLVVFLTTFFGRWAVGRIGGVTGDTIGACTEIGETLVLIMALGIR
jgi:cobalamin 5'-phosphate synthase/cobalamin synthase